MSRTLLILALLASLVACSRRHRSVDTGAAGDPATEAVERAPSLGGSAAGCDEYLSTKQKEAAPGPTCNATQRIVFTKDPSGECLGCLLQGGCLNSQFGLAGRDCESATDGPDEYKAGSPEEKKCLATLACELGVDPVAPKAPAWNGPLSAACGDVDPYKCSQGSPKGACIDTIVAGFPAGTQPSAVIGKIAMRQIPSGRAGAILTCAKANKCEACLK